MKRIPKTVAELLGPRRGTVLSVPADATVHPALERMAEHDVGVLVVLDGGEPAGVFSERDLARKVELLDRTAKGTPVRDAHADADQRNLATPTQGRLLRGRLRPTSNFHHVDGRDLPR